jgi:hypothetical protein
MVSFGNILYDDYDYDTCSSVFVLARMAGLYLGFGRVKACGHHL